MNRILTNRRDDTANRRTLVTRSLSLRAATVDDKARTVQVVLATENAVRVYDWDLGIISEVLRMDGVELPTQLPMLADHECRSIEAIRGSIRNLRVEGIDLVGVAFFADDEDSERAWQKVRGGHLTDLSVGYQIGEGRVVIAPNTTATVGGRTYTAGSERLVITTRWAPYEGSLVPIGADAASKVRASNLTHRAPAPKENSMDFNTWLKARGFDPQTLTDAQRSALQADFNAQHKQTPPGDDAARAAELLELRERNAKLERSTQLRKAATAFGVTVEDKELDVVESLERGMELLMQRKAKTDESTDKPAHGVGGVVVTRDAADKFFARAQAGFLRSAGVKVEGEFANASVLSSREIIARCALLDGHTDARDWSDVDLAVFASARSRYVRTGGPNKTSSMFTTLLANTADKMLLAGFDGYDDVTYERWCTVGETNSFKTFTVAGLSTALMKVVAEGEAAKELQQADGGYSPKLAVYGGTIRLTFQAITDDELGQFMESVRRIGANARRTIEVEAFRALLNGGYGADTTTGATLATEGNLDKVRAAFRVKKNPVGEKMNASPRFLLHDPANAVNAQKATGQIYAPGQTLGVSTGSKSIECIESALISDTTLKSGVLSTDYYLAGDPRLLDTVRVTFLRGVRKPFFMEFDQGASFAQGYKAFLPLVATQATHNDETATARASGTQKATVA